MSGPKVVRIVTREELISLCQEMLAGIDAAVAEWIRVGQRNESIDEDAIASTRQRRDRLAAMIAADRFTDFQRQAALEEQFLRDDMQRRIAAVAAAKAAARSKERRGREAATSLMKRLRDLKIAIPQDLVERLTKADADALSEAFKLLEKAVPGSDGPVASTSLAASLREDAGSRSFADWLARQPTAYVDPAIERLQARLDEMSDHPTAPTWQVRLNEVETAEGPRRDLILDALEVETARALAETRKRHALILDVRMRIAELASISTAGGSPLANLEQLDLSALETLLAETQATLTARREAAAAISRREAVLEGLAKLGYRTTEGMTLASPQDGRLVLRSTTRPDYGVEVSLTGSERMQMRAVAFERDGQAADPGRDRDAETIWCGEVSELGTDLARAGSGLVIEKSRPIGEVPLKRVALSGTSDAHAADHRSPQQRTLR